MFNALKKYKYDLLICISLLAISIIENIHINFTFYRSGLRNTPSFSFIVIGLFYEFLKLSIVFLSVVRIFIGLKYYQRSRKYILTALLTVLIFIGSWILPFTIGQPGVVHFLRGYEQWVKKNVQIDKIQEWLAFGGADKYMNKSYSDNFPDDFPEFIANFKYISIFFHNSDSENGKCIEFDCSIGLSYTGIVVGLPDMKVQTKGVIKKSESFYEYRRLIKPGVYIFDGG